MSQLSSSLSRKIRQAIRDEKNRFAIAEALNLFSEIILSVASDHRAKKDIDENEKGRAALIFLDLHSVLASTSEQIQSSHTETPKIPTKTLHLTHLDQ